MERYKVLVSIEILRLSRPKARERDQIIAFLENLAENPGKRGDYEERDEVGRPVQIKIVGGYALTYWADHAVKEVKLIHLEEADRH